MGNKTKEAARSAGDGFGCFATQPSLARTDSTIGKSLKSPRVGFLTPRSQNLGSNRGTMNLIRPSDPASLEAQRLLLEKTLADLETTMSRRAT